MSNTLQDRVIIVTGAASGIGLGIAQTCTQAGAQVAGFDISKGFDGYNVDVSDATSFADAIAQARADFGRIDGIVNNAGVTLTAPFLDAPLEQWETLWQVNQRSVLVGCQAVARIMVADGKGGALVNIASNHARASDVGYEAYAGTKGAITAMTRAMAWSLGPHGIRVNALCPGLTMTDAVAQVAKDPARAAEFNDWHATGRVNSIQDVGHAAVFLLSDASTALSGTEIIADQGMSSRLGALGF